MLRHSLSHTLTRRIAPADDAIMDSWRARRENYCCPVVVTVRTSASAYMLKWIGLKSNRHSVGRPNELSLQYSVRSMKVGVAC